MINRKFSVKEPTSEQCNSNYTYEVEHNGAYWSCLCTYYPQMGGYCGRCVVVMPKNSEHSHCFDVLVWHDGDFPFKGKSPIEMHHCEAQQFIDFGTLINNFERTKAQNAN